MNQKLELIKHKARVNNLKIETNLLQRTNEAYAYTRKYILLVELARLARCNNISQVWRGVPPPVVRNLIHMDCL